ncbi:MAG: hypothetical protein EP334_06545 [Gammaproteobacteria bacterium]|nr:MAG: hypothetical protein EP334_06545 [Gammaproteobacteria bacterium]
MISGLLSKKEVLLAVIPAPDGSLLTRYVKVNGSRVKVMGEGVPAKVSSPLRASIFSLDSYFEQAELNSPSDKMLPLVARRHVDGELIFQGESYRLRARSRSKRERSTAADIAAMPESDLQGALSQLPLQKAPCLQLVPPELAIAALVNSHTSEPVIVFWEREGVLLSLLIADGMVQTRMCERVSDSNRESILTRAESGLRSSSLHHGDTREIHLVLYTGELCGLESLDRDKASQALEKKLTHQFRLGRKLPKDSVLRYPEIFGLSFVSKDWSFLERDYREKVQAWIFAKPVAALASAAGVAFALFGGIQHIQAMTVAYKFDARRTELNTTLAEIERIRLSDAEMQSVREGLEIQKQSVNEVRLDRMLEWLSHLIPEGVAIRDLQVMPSPPPRQSRGLLPVSYPPGQKPFIVKLEIMLADTELDDAEASSAEVVRHLSQRLQMVDTRLDVPKPDPGVRRNVKLVVNALARAEDFDL